MALQRNLEYLRHLDWVQYQVSEDLERGIQLLSTINKPIVTFLGSHINEKNEKWYLHCKQVAEELGKRGFAIASGGGPGIMNAANSGAMQAGTESIGLRASLIKGEETDNDIYTHLESFHFLFVRRFILSVKSEYLIFYPGGFGTLNELYEYVVLMQVHMSDVVPIILVGKEFWQGMIDWEKKHMCPEKYITQEHLERFTLVDTPEEIYEIIKQ